MNSAITDKLLDNIKTYQKEKEINLIKKAIKFSKEAHSQQFRVSGDPYYFHTIEVAKLLAEIKLDSSSIACGLLHDTVEDTKVTLQEIENNFGSEISNLVDGLTKINKFALRDNNLKFGENYRKLLLATSQDLRVIVIKLADRLHNMRTVNFLKDNDKILNIALETQEIYAPLAQRLGIRDWQEQLEDLSFKAINPEARSSILDRLEYLNKEDKNIIDEISYELKLIFQSENVNCEIYGRLKSPYSIWNKIKNKNISFEQLSDIMAFRVITNSTRECYKALGIIHRKFNYIQGRFKDFISSPKSNGYRSLHTSIIGPKNKRIEIQFRSNVMNQIADFGVAAHWKYKNPKKIKEKDSNDYKWIHDLIELMDNSSSQDELIENSKIKLFKENIYVFSPKGGVFELPINATSIDFAYSIHSEIGDRCVACKINGKSQPLKTKLKNGDQVEIITSDNSQPSPLWERFTVTSKVKSQLRRFMRSKKIEEHISFGKKILENTFSRENIDFSETAINKILENFNLKNIDNLYELIGSGSITASTVIKKIFPELKFNYKKKNKNPNNKPIKLKGLTLGMTYNLAGCCSPIKGDNIVGISTAGLGVSVHTIECEILESYADSPERWIDVSWESDNSVNQLLIARINVTMTNKPGSLGKITTTIAKNNGNISNIRFKNRKDDFFETIIDIEVRDKNHLSNIFAAIRILNEVSSCERIKG